MSILIGKKAPEFTAQAVVNGSEFVEKYLVEKI